MKAAMTNHAKMASLATLLNAVKETAALVGRVTAKYPYTSLPPALQPYAMPAASISVRFSSQDPDTLRLLITSGFNSRSASMPASWVGAPQRDVAKAVRLMCQEHQTCVRTRRLERLRREISASEKAIAHAADVLERQRSEFKNLCGGLENAA